MKIADVLRKIADAVEADQDPGQPDPKLHQSISFLKSAVRISGYVALFWSLSLGAIILIISELIGIIEELV